MFRSTTALPIAAVCAVFCGASASAQGPGNSGFAAMGGAMHAGAEVCGDYGAAQLQKMKAEQQAKSQQQGVSADVFETAFKRGYDQSKARFAAASPAEKAKQCAQMRTMRGR